MSTSVGTLQPKVRLGRTFAAAAIVVLAIATLVVFVDSTRRGAEREASVTSTTAANTPTELRGGIAQTAAANTVANTPTELRGGIAGSAAANTVANTPTELSGGMALSFAGSTLGTSGASVTARGKQLGVEFGSPPSAGDPVEAGGEICQICWKYR